MTMIWFKKFGWIYRPVSFMGGIITIVTLLLCVQIFIFVNYHTQSISDLFYGVFPYIVSYLVVAGWIASNTCE